MTKKNLVVQLWLFQPVLFEASVKTRGKRAMFWSPHNSCARAKPRLSLEAWGKGRRTSYTITLSIQGVKAKSAHLYYIVCSRDVHSSLLHPVQIHILELGWICFMKNNKFCDEICVYDELWPKIVTYLISYLNEQYF